MVAALSAELAGVREEAQSLRAALASAKEQIQEGNCALAGLNGQLCEARQRLSSSEAAAEEQAVRAKVWEERAMGASAASLPTLLTAAVHVIHHRDGVKTARLLFRFFSASFLMAGNKCCCCAGTVAASPCVGRCAGWV